MNIHFLSTVGTYPPFDILDRLTVQENEWDIPFPHCMQT